MPIELEEKVSKYKCEVCGQVYVGDAQAAVCERNHAVKKKQEACEHENVEYYIDVSDYYDGDHLVALHKKCKDCYHQEEKDLDRYLATHVANLIWDKI